MLFAVIVLIFSTALFFLYLQSTCERVLRQQFDQDFFQSIAQVCRLEFPSLRLAIGRHEVPIDYASMCAKLRVDFVVLSSLKDTAYLAGRRCLGERLLGVYFDAILLALPLLQVVGLGKRAIRKLTEILLYSANIVGKHLSSAPLAEALTPSQYVAGP